LARSTHLDAVHRARHRANDARDLFLGNLHLRTAQSDRARRLLTGAIGPRQRVRADPAAVPTPDSRARRNRPLAAVGVHRDSGGAHPAALLASAKVACGPRWASAFADIGFVCRRPNGPGKKRGFCRLLSAIVWAL